MSVVATVRQTKYHVHLENLVIEHLRISNELDALVSRKPVSGMFGNPVSDIEQQRKIKRLQILNREIIELSKICREENLKAEAEYAGVVPEDDLDRFVFADAVAAGEEVERLQLRNKTRRVNYEMQLLQHELDFGISFAETEANGKAKANHQ